MCHGNAGAGDGDLARERSLVIPPLRDDSLIRSGDVRSVRRRIFVGCGGAMPKWGLHGLEYRDIDAVTAFICRWCALDDS
jgi:hypothetical protein